MASETYAPSFSRTLQKSRFYYESQRQELPAHHGVGNKLPEETYVDIHRSCNMPIRDRPKDDLPPLRVRILLRDARRIPRTIRNRSKAFMSLKKLIKKSLKRKAKKHMYYQKKWEGKATEKLSGVKLEQVWRTLLEDFCSVHKWLPTIDTCHHVQGLEGQAGVIRYCASTTTTTTSSSPLDNNESKNTIIKWCHEKLISVDPLEHCMSYQVLNNNLGFKYYVSKMKVLELEKGCEIEWSFAADPVEGLTCEAFLGYLSLALKGMVQNMEKALSCKNLEN